MRNDEVQRWAAEVAKGVISVDVTLSLTVDREQALRWLILFKRLERGLDGDDERTMLQTLRVAFARCIRESELGEVLRQGEGWRAKAQALKDWDGRGDIPPQIDPCTTKPSLGVELPGSESTLREVEEALRLAHGLAVAERSPATVGLCEALEIIREMGGRADGWHQAPEGP